MIIYKNCITCVGSHINDFKDNDMFITFGDDLPDSLKEYCCSVSITRVLGSIESGDILEIDGKEFKITAVGDQVVKNLNALGHATFLFNSADNADMPGTIYMEKGEDMPILKKGSSIIIKN